MLLAELPGQNKQKIFSINDNKYLKRFTESQIDSGKKLASRIRDNFYKNPPSDPGLKYFSETGKQQSPYLYLRDLHAVLVYPRHGGWSFDCVFVDDKGESRIMGHPEQVPPLETRQNALDAATVRLESTYHNELNNITAHVFTNDENFPICGHDVNLVDLVDKLLMAFL